MKFFIAFIFVLFVTCVSAQSDTAKTILNRQLKWNDFAGEVDKTSPYSAMTYWSVNYKYQSKWGSESDVVSVTFTVEPRFGNRS